MAMCSCPCHRSGTNGAHSATNDTTENRQPPTVLAALLNVMIPLVKAAVPNCTDLRQVSLDHEAEELLFAFRTLVLSIFEDRLKTESQGGMTRTVELDGMQSLPRGSHMSNQLLDASPERFPPLRATGKKKGLDDVEAHITSNRPESSDKEQRTVNSPNVMVMAAPRIRTDSELLNEALTSLRTRVFNEMPIRMLTFERKGSKLDITLQDRAGVYAHISPKLRKRFNDYSPSATRTIDWKTLSGWVSDLTSYAVLSHVWNHSTAGELTYGDWYQNGLDLTHPGYKKLVRFCDVAEKDYGVYLGWMDTVCINKSSSSELDESIRSMYKWYQKSKVCITYLAKSTTLADIHNDVWFTRGWTLQELFAPRRIKFYDTYWRKLKEGVDNDKAYAPILEQIKSATTITPNELASPSMAPISRRMQWAATRQVSREEDSAYSLIGIFGIGNMSIAYGEGAQLAFVRVLREILNTTRSQVADLFNWAGEHNTNTSALLPSTPLAFFKRSKDVTDMLRRVQATEPIVLTHLGLRIPVLLLPATTATTASFESIGDYHATATIQPASGSHIPSSYNILDAKTRSKLAAWVFVILNCSSDDSNVHVAKDCFAVLFRDPTHSIYTYMITPTGLKEKISTKDPIVFQLNNRTALSQKFYTIQKSQLGSHGMQFSSMYL